MKTIAVKDGHMAWWNALAICEDSSQLSGEDDPFSECPKSCLPIPRQPGEAITVPDEDAAGFIVWLDGFSNKKHPFVIG
jgi:hypothetical protein